MHSDKSLPGDAVRRARPLKLRVSMGVLGVLLFYAKAPSRVPGH